MAKTTTTKTFRRLFRSEDDRVLGGVAGGLGDYFSFDPNILRLVFVLTAVFGGGGVLAYLILWIVLPTQSGSKFEGRDYIHDNVAEIKSTAKNFREQFKSGRRQGRPRLGGIILLAIGIIFLLQNFGFFGFWNFSQLWPLILVALGIVMISNQHDR